MTTLSESSVANRKCRAFRCLPFSVPSFGVRNGFWQFFFVSFFVEGRFAERCATHFRRTQLRFSRIPRFIPVFILILLSSFFAGSRIRRRRWTRRENMFRQNSNRYDWVWPRKIVHGWEPKTSMVCLSLDRFKHF